MSLTLDFSGGNVQPQWIDHCSNSKSYNLLDSTLCDCDCNITVAMLSIVLKSLLSKIGLVALGQEFCLV